MDYSPIFQDIPQVLLALKLDRGCHLMDNVIAVEADSKGFKQETMEMFSWEKPLVNQDFAMQ